MVASDWHESQVAHQATFYGREVVGRVHFGHTVSGKGQELRGQGVVKLSARFRIYISSVAGSAAALGHGSGVEWCSSEA